ncbi:HK97 gp10 family phage protein [Streptomyces phaeochromogenes]
MSKSYEINVSPNWPKHLREAAQDFLTDIAKEVHRDMVRYAPVNTGRLRNDLDWEVNGLKARVGARTVEYAIFVEEGTSPHSIKAKNGGALNWPGASHPVNEVNHPGTQASWFMRRATYQKR